jgi:hypothetical protein
MSPRSLPRALTVLLVLSGCALFGKKDTSMDKWQKDAHAHAKEATPEMERDLATRIEQQTERITEMDVQVVKSTDALADILQGKAPMGSLAPATFESQTKLLTKHLGFPKLRPFDERELNAFFEPMSDADQKKLQKLYKNRELATQVTTSLAWLQGAGYSILLEQNRAVALNWGAELMALWLGSEVLAFEKTTETKASNETLEKLAVTLAYRNHSRGLLVTNTAALAVFEGVAKGGDPAAISALAGAMQAHASVKPQATVEEVRAFVDGLEAEALDVAGALEAGMRGAVGDKSYDNAYQAGLVQTLGQIEKAQAQASIYQQIDDQAKQAKQAEAQELARTVKDRLVARAKELGVAKANGLIGAIPGGKQLLAGLRAIKELRNGNPRGALEAALEAAPPGAVGEGLRAASKIAFGIADTAKRARGR